MSSQVLKRLRTMQQPWLHRITLAKKASQFIDDVSFSTFWVPVAAGILGAGSYFLSEAASSTDDHVSDDDYHQTSVPNPKLSSFSRLLPVQSCHCQAKQEMSYNLFGRTSNLRRSNTIVRYKNEVSQESVRTLYKVNWKKPLGQGGFGAVYEAKDRRTGEKVALKQISKKYTNDTGFQREMEALLHLRREGGHPKICGLRENFDEGNYFYFSLDLISGGELFDHLIRSGPYSEEDAARLVREVASALSFMHGIGFVHG